MLSIILIKKILSLFMVMAGGILLVKTGIAETQESSILSKMSLYMIMPCVIISSYQIDYTAEIRDGLILAFVAAILIHVIFIVLNMIFRKSLGLTPVEQTSIIYTNSGNLIIPLVTAMLGPKMLIYASAYVSVQQFMFWSHAKSVLSGETKMNFRKMFLNINMFAIAIGIVIFFGRFTFPDFVTDGIETIASLAGPAAMMVVGMLIGSMDFSCLKKYRRLWMVVALRLLVLSFFMAALLKYSGIADVVSDGADVLLVTLLAAIAPTASTVTQMAQVYGSTEDASYASAISVVGTLACIVTMPLVVAFYTM